MKRLSHAANRSLPPQGWHAFVRAAAAVESGSIGSLAVSRQLTQRKAMNGMVPGEGSA